MINGTHSEFISSTLAFKVLHNNLKQEHIKLDKLFEKELANNDWLIFYGNSFSMIR
jgi:hypothetical protein